VKVRELEKELARLCARHPDLKLLMSVPGIGRILASVIGAEIDGIERFVSKKKFVAYCGLAPVNKGSAGVVYQGRMIVTCNKWLKWAFIEAAWVAVGCDGGFGSQYRRHRERGKKANTAITIVAQRMAKICWEILTDRREYEVRLSGEPGSSEKNFPARSEHGLVGEAA